VRWDRRQRKGSMAGAKARRDVRLQTVTDHKQVGFKH
jgi:hypothetical protein